MSSHSQAQSVGLDAVACKVLFCGIEWSIRASTHCFELLWINLSHSPLKFFISPAWQRIVKASPVSQTVEVQLDPGVYSGGEGGALVDKDLLAEGTNYLRLKEGWQKEVDPSLLSAAASMFNSEGGQKFAPDFTSKCNDRDQHILNNALVQHTWEQCTSNTMSRGINDESSTDHITHANYKPFFIEFLKCLKDRQGCLLQYIASTREQHLNIEHKGGPKNGKQQSMALGGASSEGNEF
ncbi:hypothetical protein EV421DRAFT_1742220 [Armillaria borealis]|uniref:Uncharacterized protein n=1 Tax=Armillaria borealis TaxID=47425 RepID=A0AA39IZS7_9AGAR|nr:hypothetical protein EV421DRAFT_1742220 [Armillaria borealis]